LRAVRTPYEIKPVHRTRHPVRPHPVRPHPVRPAYSPVRPRTPTTPYVIPARPYAVRRTDRDPYGLPARVRTTRPPYGHPSRTVVRRTTRAVPPPPYGPARTDQPVGTPYAPSVRKPDIGPVRPYGSVRGTAQPREVRTGAYGLAVRRPRTGYGPGWAYGPVRTGPAYGAQPVRTDPHRARTPISVHQPRTGSGVRTDGVRVPVRGLPGVRVRAKIMIRPGAYGMARTGAYGTVREVDTRTPPGGCGGRTGPYGIVRGVVVHLTTGPYVGRGMAWFGPRWRAGGRGWWIRSGCGARRRVRVRSVDQCWRRMRLAPRIRLPPRGGSELVGIGL